MRVAAALAATRDVRGMVAIDPTSGAAAIRRAAEMKRAAPAARASGGGAGGTAGAGTDDADAAAATEDDGGIFEDDGPVWPDEATEAAMLAEQRDRAEATGGGEMAKPRKKPIDDDEPETMRGNLPPLDELVARVPAEVRATLEELFRAKFVRVARVPKAVLKSASAEQE